MKYQNYSDSPSYDVTWKILLKHYWRVWRDREDIEQAMSYNIMKKEVVIENINRNDNIDAVTWLGHASLLIKLNSKRILCDPLLTRHVYPIPFYINKNMLKPIISTDELPDIDVLMITHNHFDHLNLPTIAAIKNKNSIRIIVPKGVGHYFKKQGYERIEEVSWNDHIKIDDIDILVVPAIHSSRRTLFDKDETPWCSYLFKTADLKIFLSCDTAYGKLYENIAASIAPIDLAILSIGAYEPQIFYKSLHAVPEDSIKIAINFQAKKILPIHWGTLKISEESINEPGRRFQKAALNNGMKGEDVWLLKVGETRNIIATKILAPF